MNPPTRRRKARPWKLPCAPINFSHRPGSPEVESTPKKRSPPLNSHNMTGQMTFPRLIAQTRNWIWTKTLQFSSQEKLLLIGHQNVNYWKKKKSDSNRKEKRNYAETSLKGSAPLLMTVPSRTVPTNSARRLMSRQGTNSLCARGTMVSRNSVSMVSDASLHTFSAILSKKIPQQNPIQNSSLKMLTKCSSEQKIAKIQKWPYSTWHSLY